MATAEARAALGKSLRESSKHKAALLSRKIPNWPNWTEYGTHKFRSTWERDFAVYLDSTGLASWSYEPRKFQTPVGVYLPDFRVETLFGACYVELHRIERPRQGDEAKVAKLRAIAEAGWLDLPLFLLGELDVASFRRAMREEDRARG